MKKTSANIIINLYGIVFAGLGIAAFCLRPRIFVAALMLIWAGVSLLRRKAFGVYAVLFMSFVMAGIGLLFVGLVFYDMAHRIYKFEMLLTGLIFAIPSFLSFFFFTRPQVAESFGLSKITILEKVDKKQLIAAGQFLLILGLGVGLVFLACYFAAMRMTRS
jgi:hypothetical protein